MTVSLTHSKVSGKSAGTDSTLIYGTHWDAEHTLSGTPTAIVGFDSTGSATEYLPTGTGSVVFDSAPTISNPVISGHATIESVTPTGATGTGNLVFDSAPTVNSVIANNATLNAPTVSNGMSADSILVTNLLGIISSGDTTKNLSFSTSEVMTANRVLNFVTSDADRTITLGGDLTLSASVTLPNLAQGDVLYANSPGNVVGLSKSASTSRYLSNQGTSNNPNWDLVNLANGVTDNLSVANLNSGTGATASTLWHGDGSWAQIDLATQVLGNLSVSHLNSASGASSTTYWAGDGTWRTPVGAGDVVGPGSATDNAAVRFNSTTGTIVQNSALLIADTTGAISRSGGGGIPIEGTNTTDSASVGYVGEYMTATLASGSAVGLTTATAKTIQSISLTAGDWDVEGVAGFNPTGGPTTTNCAVGINTTTDAFPTNLYDGGVQQWSGSTTSNPPYLSTGRVRISISTTTTVYLIGYAEFTGGTALGGFGRIRARRVR